MHLVDIVACRSWGALDLEIDLLLVWMVLHIELELKLGGIGVDAGDVHIRRAGLVRREDFILSLETMPELVAVRGAGPIGDVMAQVRSRMSQSVAPLAFKPIKANNEKRVRHKTTNDAMQCIMP